MDFHTSPNNIEELEVDGIIIGVYDDKQMGVSASRLADQLNTYLDLDDFSGKKKQKLILYNVDGIKARRTVLVGLGKQEESNHEHVRLAAAIGAKSLREVGCKHIAIEALNKDAQSTAEGVILGLYRFDELKQKKEDLKTIDEITFAGNDQEVNSWNVGKVIAEAQNLARRLAELPANIATPTFFVDTAIEEFKGLENVVIEGHDEDWAREHKMGSFLSVASGSDEPARFLVIRYTNGGEAKPLAFVGKGITFDSGGISIKGSSGMGLMRGDCGGAAAVIGTLLAITKLKLPINAIGITPLTENMPSGKATKPSDVVIASNNKSIEVDNTDAEGRLVLADGLVYAETFNPDTVIDIATLTGAIMVALGSGFIGAFTRSDELWNELNQAGNRTYERFWRMPLDQVYKKQLKSTLADVKNVGGRPAGSVTAAMFLGEFVEAERWCHLDIAGVAWTTSAGTYKPHGMTGIPVRALVNFAQNRVK